MTLRRAQVLILLAASATTMFAQGRRGGGMRCARGLPFRFMGPAVGNRISAAAGIPGDPTTYYVGAASGGVWKSTDSGQQLGPDLRQQSALGDRRARPRAVRPQDRVGRHRRGLGHPRQRHDGQRRLQVHRRRRRPGPTWASTRPGRIGRIIVHPTNPDIVYVCAAGRLTGPQQERGVFKTTDGGKTWTALAVRRSEHRLLRPLDGRQRSQHADRGHVGSGDAHLRDVQRRTGQRRLRHARWRRELEAHRRPRAAEIAGRQDRCGDRAEEFQARLRADPDRRPGLGLALRRWRRKLGGGQLAARADRPRRVLHPPQRQSRRIPTKCWWPTAVSGSPPTAASRFRTVQLGRRHARYLDGPRTASASWSRTMAACT